ncbi:MAG: FAD-linked oxidase C-terminal domain-containing protein [Thermodesulfobacteriota bacterium]
MSRFATLDSGLLEEIRAAVGREAVLTADADLDAASADATTERRRPEAVVRAASAEQVSALLRLANARRFPVTPRGTGTGLAGGALATHGGVVLDLTAMDELAIEPANLLAVAGPGALTQALRQEAEKHGLFYPPDPASLKESTLGGNAATNAGGPACVKYGVTKNYVLGLEAVLPTGEIVSCGTRTRKGVVGYDLASLLVGSEGTLGVITKLYLKLIPLPRAVQTQVAVFPSLAAAIGGVADIMAGGCCPSACEFLDPRCLALVGDLLPFGDLPRGASLLLLETDGSAEAAAADMALVSEVCRKSGALHLLPASGPAERETLWSVRRQVSLRIHEAWPVYVPEDVVLPLAEIAGFVAELPEHEREFGLTIYAFGHAGDGNIHLNITAPDRSTMDKVEEGTVALLRRVLELGGTMSGEHGIGFTKQRFLGLELSPASMRAQAAIKRVLDPNGILNPGKLFDEDPA